MTVTTPTVLLLVIVTASAPSAERSAKNSRDRMASAPRARTGLALRVEIEPGRVTLRRPQDLITPTRGLPGVYTGAADPLLAVALGEGEVRQAEGSWVHQDYRYGSSPDAARVIVSRLSPAVLFDIPEKTLRLAAAGPESPRRATLPGARRSDPTAGVQGKLPRYFAWAEAGRAVVRKSSDLGPTAPLQLDEPWVLAWFGTDTAARGHAEICDVDSKAGPQKALIGQPQCLLDVPLLLRLEHRPSAICVEGDQIVFEFATAAGKVAVMPVFGRRAWLPEETESWHRELPEQVIQQCRLWSRWLRDFPLTVAESFEIEEGGDALLGRQAFQWISLEDEWGTPPVKAAPLSPMLALALGGGVPVSLLADGKSVRPADGNLMDFAGKMMVVEGAESYEYRLTGLGDLLWRSPDAAAVAAEARPLQARLENHVADMVSAGHLRPLFILHGGPGSWNASWYWVGTPETAYALARAMPYLSTELQARVREYVRAEWREYAPLELDGRYYTQGSPREPYTVEKTEQRSDVVRRRDEWYRRRNFWLDLYRIETATSVIGGLPEDGKLRERAAALAADLSGRLDWAILGPVRLQELRSSQEIRFTTLQGSAAYNGWLAGAIGYARLARKHGWREEERLAYCLVAKLALARVGQARYVAEMHRMGLVRGNPEGDYRAVSHVDERCTVVRWGPLTTGVAEDQEFPPFIDLVPEVGRLLADYARPQCEVYLNYLDHAAPYWYLSEAPKQSATEHHLCPLWHQSGNVPAHAWILGKRGKEFSRYVDATRFRGDLFTIQNLVTAIEAYRP
ncbi:MAG: hypothetical protein H8E44_16345 [Planctomycetes bacterium]|nr:hypothetical protein [Planctomycetota bacterium]MBL7037076.1 hypothetical protein [Pirellulaceae bacterium]